MVKVFAYILLLIHINTTLFIPVADEKDVYDKRGRQIGDINTTFEFIDQVILGHTVFTHEDPDDDQAHFFTGSIVSYYISNHEQINCSRPEPTTKDLAIAYPLMAVQKPFAIAYDILTPPPKA